MYLRSSSSRIMVVRRACSFLGGGGVSLAGCILGISCCILYMLYCLVNSMVFSVCFQCLAQVLDFRIRMLTGCWCVLVLLCGKVFILVLCLKS